MKYLRIRGSENRKRADGSIYKQASIIEKGRKYGPQLSEQAVSVKRPVLVTGAHDSGKSRFLKRLYENERELYGAKIKAPALFLSAFKPLAQWTTLEELATWYPTSKANPKGVLWSDLKHYEKLEQLPHYLAETKAVLFVDDAHKLTGRKLQIARDCVLAANIYILSASDVQRLPPNLRGIVLRRDPQIFTLATEVSYDMTQPLMYLVMLFFLLIGYWEATAVIGGLKLLATGSRATKDT